MHEPALLSRRAIASAIPLALAASTTAALPMSSAADPVLAQIELHKALRLLSNTHPGDDSDPAYQAACADEEAAIQALGEMMPKTLFGAAAQLRYMAEVEEAFADDQSPLVRCVRTVATALARGLPA